MLLIPGVFQVSLYINKLQENMLAVFLKCCSIYELQEYVLAQLIIGLLYYLNGIVKFKEGLCKEIQCRGIYNVRVFTM